MSRRPVKPYHHRNLRQAVIDAALAEIEAVGASRLSLREIARRAGVSHAAPAHHFGDKRGLFTVIATEGFALLRRHQDPWVDAPNALLQAGLGYIGFALTHRAHFEVMFRPDLYDSEDPDLQSAMADAFGVLYSAVEAGLATNDPARLLGTSVAAWSAVHGFASLWLSGNFAAELTGDMEAFGAQVIAGMVSMGEIVRAQAQAPLPPLSSYGIAPSTG